jgi:hypothetical protein
VCLMVVLILGSRVFVCCVDSSLSRTSSHPVLRIFCVVGAMPPNSAGDDEREPVCGDATGTNASSDTTRQFLVSVQPWVAQGAEC